MMEYKILDRIDSPEDVKKLNFEELNQLSGEIRDYIIRVVSKNGGHLAPNLGAVELTLALHKVFNFREDKLIFDVSHQIYAHKLITGRRKTFESLRTYGGISGYANPAESPYDVFIAGHASTSLSLAVGFVKAREFKKENYEIVALIGDGALTAGEAYEGLNSLGNLHKKVIVILNDNGMSIARNVGSLSHYLYRLRSSKTYLRLKRLLDTNLGRKIKLAIKELLLPSVIFEEFGYTYLGPIDGHNIKELSDVLKRSKNIQTPVLIHVITQKGKGYQFSENDPVFYHGTDPFDIDTGETTKKYYKTFSDYLEDILLKEGEKEKKLFVISAAMPDGTKTAKFRDTYPERFLDVGIAEQTAVTAAAALAKEGFKPVVAIYSTFMQRAFDQLIHDVSILELPVIFVMDRSGIVSDDGPTHQGIFDIAYMSLIPSFIVTAPKDGEELKQLLKLALKSNKPFVIRYPKDYAEPIYSKGFDYEIGKSEIFSEGNDLLIISYGALFGIAKQAAEGLTEKGYSVGLINGIFAKPLDEKTIVDQAKRAGKVVTIEDGTNVNGFGTMVKSLLINHGINVYSFGINDFFPEQGKRKYLLDKYGLSAQKILVFCEGIIGEKKAR